MKSYDRPTLAAIARNVIKKYDPYLLYCEPCAVPIEKITEQFYGLDVEYCHLRKNGLVLGCTIFDNTLLPIWDADECQYGVMRVNGGTIVIEASLLDERKQGRLRFTFAHELAHWLLHKELYVGEGIAAASAIKTSLEVNPVVERQADVLASYLLMPKNQVKRAFYAIHDKPKDTKKTLEGRIMAERKAVKTLENSITKIFTSMVSGDMSTDAFLGKKGVINTSIGRKNAIIKKLETRLAAL